MDYDGRFIMQKTVDWSLLNDGMTIICDEVSLARQNRCKHHSALVLRNVPVSACALLKAWDESILSPNYHRIIHMNVFVKPNDQSKACLCFGMARKRRIQSNNPHFNRKKFQFEFQNGEMLRLKLYEHLKV